MKRVLIAGCGYVGSALGERLVSDGCEVWGLRRRVVSLPEGVTPIEVDLGLPALTELPERLDHVFYMLSPGGGDDALYRTAYVEGLRNLIDALARAGQAPRRIFFASSTSVYGECNGEWVDEGTPPGPGHPGGRRILEGESLLAASPFASTVVRFGGIYGPRRTRLVDAVRAGSATYRQRPPQYTNRIHRDDCAGVLRHLMGLESPAKLYLAVDSEPAEEGTVLRWIAGALGAAAPRAADEGGTLRRRGNKRCRNGLLLDSGYSFEHPTFREGYARLLAEHR